MIDQIKQLELNIDLDQNDNFFQKDFQFSVGDYELMLTVKIMYSCKEAAFDYDNEPELSYSIVYSNIDGVLYNEYGPCAPHPLLDKTLNELLEEALTAY